MKKIISVIIVILCVTILSSCMTAKKRQELARNKPLKETYWVLTAVDGNPIPKSFVTPNIIFDGKGHFTGNLGCNSFGGSYFSNKDRLSMSYSGATKRLCENMKVEKMFMSALQREVKTFSINVDTLRIMDKQGEVMRFIAGEKPQVQVQEEE